MKVELTLFNEKAILDLPTYAPMDLAIARAFQVCCEGDTYKELTVNHKYNKVKVKIIQDGPVPQCNELVEKYGLSGLYMANPLLEHFDTADYEALVYDIATSGNQVKSKSKDNMGYEWFNSFAKDKLHLFLSTGSLIDANDVRYLEELGLSFNA